GKLQYRDGRPRPAGGPRRNDHHGSAQTAYPPHRQQTRSVDFEGLENGKGLFYQSIPPGIQKRATVRISRSINDKTTWENQQDLKSLIGCFRRRRPLPTVKRHIVNLYIPIVTMN